MILAHDLGPILSPPAASEAPRGPTQLHMVCCREREGLEENLGGGHRDLHPFPPTLRGYGEEGTGHLS